MFPYQSHSVVQKNWDLRLYRKIITHHSLLPGSMRAKLIDDKCVSADHREPQGLFMRARTLSSRSFIGTSRKALWLLSSPTNSSVDRQWMAAKPVASTDIDPHTPYGQRTRRMDGRTDEWMLFCSSFTRFLARAAIKHPCERARVVVALCVCTSWDNKGHLVGSLQLSLFSPYRWYTL